MGRTTRRLALGVASAALVLAPTGVAGAEPVPAPTSAGEATTPSPTDPAVPSTGPTSPAAGTPAPAPTGDAASAAAPTPLPPAPRPTTSPRVVDGRSVRTSVACASCAWPWQWVAGVGQTQVRGMVLPARAGVSVRVLRATPGATTYAQVATVGTDSRGRFTWTGPMTAAGTSRYQAVVVGGPASTVASATVVAPALTAAAPVTTNTLVNPLVTGVATPRAAGLAVQTQVLVDGAWRTSVRGTTGAGGAYRLPLTYANGYDRSVTVRTAIPMPGGRTLYSPARVVRRVATFDPRVRGTVAADVSRTYRAGCPVGPSRLSTIDMNHWGFDGRVHRGRLVIRTGNVQPILSSFRLAFDRRFPIREMRDSSVYGGNDVTSMEHDNTNGFNCRRVVGNPYRMSPHSYGTSIDINPVENPYRIPAGTWLPSNGRAYVARSPYRPGMLTYGHYFVTSLQGNGFRWLSGFDWQHFQR